MEFIKKKIKLEEQEVGQIYNGMELKYTEHFGTSHLFFNAGNGQAFREYILRTACEKTDFYATDILILMDSLKEKLFSEIDQVDIYFRQCGVDWIYTPTEYKSNIPKHYRFHIRLVREGRYIALYSKHGNC